ncbi:MAG: Lpg1974 family pore-forming outer membrane protein [Chlamydiota bacterium]
MHPSAILQACFLCACFAFPLLAETAEENIVYPKDPDFFLDPDYYCFETFVPGYNKSASIDVCSCYDQFLTTLSFLYLSAQEEGLSLGLLGDSTNELYHLLQLPAVYAPGFRVGLGWYIDENNWDITTEYTRFHHEQTATFSTSSGESIVPFWLSPLTDGRATRASTTWDLEIDCLDAELGKAYYLSEQNTVHPFWGARLAWISQEYTPTYELAGKSIPTKSQIRSWGFGLRMGMQTDWFIYGGARLIAKTSSSFLYTHYKLCVEQQESDPTQTALSTEETPDYLRPHIDSALGVGWCDYFFNSALHIDLAFFYEFHLFWNQNIFGSAFGGTTNQAPKSARNLSLHGCTFQTRLNF